MTSIIPEAARVALEVELRGRLDRLNTLTSDQRTEALSRLAAADGGTFDQLLNEIAGPDDNAARDDWEKAEPYCLLCGGTLGPGGSVGAHQPDHEPFLAWRSIAER